MPRLSHPLQLITLIFGEKYKSDVFHYTIFSNLLFKISFSFRSKCFLEHEKFNESICKYILFFFFFLWLYFSENLDRLLLIWDFETVFRQLVGLLGQEVGPVARPLPTQDSRIRTHDPHIQAIKTHTLDRARPLRSAYLVFTVQMKE
jgi:hypothetical protein